MDCPKCKSKNEPDSEFCDQCGASLKKEEVTPKPKWTRVWGPLVIFGALQLLLPHRKIFFPAIGIALGAGGLYALSKAIDAGRYTYHERFTQTQITVERETDPGKFWFLIVTLTFSFFAIIWVSVNAVLGM